MEEEEHDDEKEKKVDGKIHTRTVHTHALYRLSMQYTVCCICNVYNIYVECIYDIYTAYSIQHIEVQYTIYSI